MNVMKQTLLQGLPELKLDLSEAQIDTLCAFGEAVVKQNEVMNLTAITEPAAVAKLHLLDSLSVLCAADLHGKTLIDVGCGAGFPGVPVAIGCSDARVTLLDSLGKRVKWLEEILPTLSENPAKEMGLFDRKGSIETGKDADLVLLDDEANVVHVFARGKQVK